MEEKGGKDQIEVVDNFEYSDDYKKKVCLPYFKDLYRDLSSRSDKREKGITKVAMLDFIDLPGIVGERFFQVSDKDKNGYIDQREFISVMLKIYCSDFPSKMKFIFDIYDFDDDTNISKEDVKTVLSHVPINQIVQQRKHSKKSEGKFTQGGGGLGIFLDRIESMEELSKMTDLCFGEMQTIDLAEFIKICEEKSSEMFLCIYNLIKSKLPPYENFQKYESKLKSHIEPSSAPMSKVLASPKVLSKFVAVSDVIKQSPFRKYRQTKEESSSESSNESEGEPNNKEESKVPTEEIKAEALLQSIPIAKFRPGLRPKAINTKGYKTLHEKNKLLDEVDSPLNTEVVRLSNISRKGIQQINSPTLYLKRASASVKMREQLFCECGRAIVQKGNIQCDKCITNVVLKVQGYLLQRKKNKASAKYWIILDHKQLYLYEKPDQEMHLKMFSLNGIFLKELDPVEIGKNVTLYPFTLSSNHKTKTFYCQNQSELDMWVKAIKGAIGYANIFDYYELKGDLGKGRFGVVYEGVHKKTQNQVAIKVMKKKRMKQQDIELVKLEVEILKICQHPNIIRLLDIFENQDYIYIVMELLKGGDLFTYLENRNFKLPESLASKYIHSLATAVYYLHSFGIIHRDVKPENIMMVDQSESSEIKLCDFGLSKIIGPNEMCKEPFGTLCYVSPEVLMQKPYSKSVDIWSLGIITYLFITGTLPFDDDDQKEIVRQTIYEQPNYTYSCWKKVSIESMELVKGLLNKNPRKRMNLVDVLQNSWVTKQSKKVRDIRRHSQPQSFFKNFSAAEPDSPMIMQEADKRAKE